MSKQIRTKAEATEDEAVMEPSIRPKGFDTYIGQRQIIDNLKIAIRSAKVRNTVLDHVLLHGPAGLGKTSLANVIANEMGAPLLTLAGPTIKRPGDIVAALSNIEEGTVVFIDEIHRMDMMCEETLYSAMEDRFVTITIGKDSQTRPIRFELPGFTLVGATTKAGSLSKPLRDRFGLPFKLEYYTEDELERIASATASAYGISLGEGCLRKIAAASRGIPRLCNRNVARVRDLVLAKGISRAEEDDTDEALRLLGIDRNGLDRTDKLILSTLCGSAKPVGLKTLSDILGEDDGTIESVYEPYLISRGYIIKTGRGRMATDKARTLMGLPPAAGCEQLSLF